MNNQSLLHILRNELKSLDDFLSALQNEKTIHQPDKDFALSKVRNLYDYLLQISCGEQTKTDETATHKHENDETELLKTNIQKGESTSFEEKTKPQIPEDVEHNEIIQEEKIKETAPAPQPTELTEQMTPKKPIKEQPEELKEEKTDLAKNNIVEPALANTEQEAPIVADKFHNKRFRHDDLANQNQKQDLSSKLQSKPITDINKAIGINDRFLFIRELFEGNKAHYHETIDILNNIDTLENALSFINDAFQWDMEAPTTEKFIELIRRKLQA